MRKFRTNGDIMFDSLNYIFLTLMIIVMLYPFLYVLSVSISSPDYVIRGLVTLLPKGFDLSAYKAVFRDTLFVRSYLNTVYYSIAATVVSIILLSLTAYPLSIRSLKGRKFFSMMFLFTMYFSGGMIPSYLVVRNLGMINTIWAIIIPGAISTYYIIICRTFFQNIPDSLRESASIDGANDWLILYRIVLPLSMPLLAIMALYAIVGQWNNFFGPFLYLTDQKMYPVQVVLRRILAFDEMMEAGSTSVDRNKLVVSLSLKSAAIMITVLPIIFSYPLLQKYFVKGVMIGSIKE